MTSNQKLELSREIRQWVYLGLGAIASLKLVSDEKLFNEIKTRLAVKRFCEDIFGKR